MRGAALLLPFQGRRPRVIGRDSSVWFGSVVRGDLHAIRIGSRTNLQDQCVVHVTRGRFGTEVGDEVTVGHRAVVHGCSVGDGALIGIGAVVLDGARVGREALVAAGAVVGPGVVIPDGALALGVPARVVRGLSAEERAAQRRRALEYVETARHYAEGGAP
jgi:carbonic anhydrase/acetyltransferase-like protein (isoleucine patch superfamily)